MNKSKVNADFRFLLSLAVQWVIFGYWLSWVFLMFGTGGAMTICCFSLRFVCPFPQDNGNPCCGLSPALRSGTVCPWFSLRLKWWRYLQPGLSFWFLWALPQRRFTIWSMPNVYGSGAIGLCCGLPCFLGLFTDLVLLGISNWYAMWNNPCGVPYCFLHLG